MSDYLPLHIQADLHCIAGTVHVMMFSKYMELTKDSAGLYKPNSTVSRSVVSC